MKTNVFPINYFSSIWTPKKIFKTRKSFNWFQIIIIFLFLNALLMVPVSINYAKMDSFPIETFYINTFEMVDDEVVSHLQNTNATNGEMSFSESFYIEKDQGVVGGGLTEAETETALQKDNALLFFEDHFSIKEAGSEVFNIPYTKDFSLEGITTVDKLNHALSELWFSQNKHNLVLGLTIVSGIAIFTNIIFTLLVPILLAYFSKKLSYSSIRTFKESVALILLAVSLPTIVAMITGLIYFDVSVMIMIQSIGLIVILFIVFFVTRLRDSVS